MTTPVSSSGRSKRCCNSSYRFRGRAVNRKFGSCSTARYCVTWGRSSRVWAAMGKRCVSARRRAISRLEPSSGSARSGPRMGVQLPWRMLVSRACHFRRSCFSSPKPGLYQMRPLFNRMNSAGIHQSGRSRTAPRATATARSTCPSWRSSSKKRGMNSATVCIVMLPCMANTAGIPASARRGPSAASAPVPASPAPSP